MFIRSCDRLIHADSIRWIDLAALEAGTIVVHHDDRRTVISGSAAIEALLVLRPSALEGKRLRWVRRAWMLHNLVGHPLLMLLALVGRVDLGLRVHEATVPRPLGFRPRTDPVSLQAAPAGGASRYTAAVTAPRDQPSSAPPTSSPPPAFSPPPTYSQCHGSSMLGLS
jgi:hypothetical protein